MTVEELQVIIAANTDQFKNELRIIQGQLRGLGKTGDTVSKSVGGNLFVSMVKANVVGSLITGTFNRFLGVLGGVGNQIITNGSSFSRLNVATKITASNVGLTAEEFKALNEQLQDANTYGSIADDVIRSIGLSGLNEMAKGLSAVDARSGETEEGVAALVLTIKDLAAISEIGSGPAINDMTRFINSGEQTEAVRGMLAGIGNLNKEYEAYAQSIGKTRADLDAQGEAQARLNLVMREGEKAFGAYAATYQTSGKIFSSIADVIRSVTEIIGSALEPILRVVGGGILQFFNGIRSSMINTEGDLVGLGMSIKNWAIRVAGYIIAVIRVIGRLLTMIPVIGKNFEGLANFTLKPIKMQGQLSKSVGSTGKAMDKTAGKSKKLKKELDDLAGFDEMEVLKEPTDSSGGTGDSLGDMGSIGGGGGDLGGLGDFADDTEAIMNVANEATKKLDKFIKKIKDFIKPLKEIKIFGKPLIEILGEMSKWFGIVGIAVAIGVKVFGIIGGVIALLTSPIALVIGAIALLVGAFILAYQNIEPFRELVNTLISLIGEVFARAWQNLGENINWFWQNILQPMFLWIQENIGPILIQVMEKLQEMATIFQEKLPEIEAAFRPLVEQVKKNLVFAFKLAGQIIDWVWKNVLKPLVDFILANIVPAFEMAIDIIIEVVKIFTTLYTTISNIIMPILEVLFTVVSTVFKGIWEVVKFAWNSVIKPVLKALWDFITGFVIPVLQTLFAIGKYVFEQIWAVVKRAWEGIKQAIQPVLNWFNNNVVPVIERLRGKFSDVFNGIKNTVGNVWESLKGSVKSGINGLISQLNSLIDKINSATKGFSELATKVPGASPITFKVSRIPYLAEGGVVSSPTLATIGEQNYQEAVLPLDRNTGWAEKVAALINGASGASEGQQLIIKLGEDTIYEKFIDYVNDKTRSSNSLVFKV